MFRCSSSKAVLPNPQTWAKTMKVKLLSVAVSAVSKTEKDILIMYMVYTRLLIRKPECSVSYTTGVPAMIGAMMFLKGLDGNVRVYGTWKNLIRIRSWKN